MMKKYILFIVEGKHDKEEINAILQTPYFESFQNSYVPCFLLPNVGNSRNSTQYSGEAGGDITADKKTDASKIQGRLNELVNDFRKHGMGYPVAHQDIARIVQITDADGAFVPPECVVPSSEPKAKYRAGTIETANVDGIRGRNKKKSEVLRKLTSVKQISNIPYSIYFVSCNMDHVLFDDRNMTPYRKRLFSEDFQTQIENNPKIIFDTVLKSGIGTNKDYDSSWLEIQQNKNSLRRSTNLNLLLMELSHELEKSTELVGV